MKEVTFYSDHFEQQVIETWGGRTGMHSAERYLLDTYLSDKRAKVCDAGTGSGRMAFYLEKEGYTEIAGFDLSAKMIEIAKERALVAQSQIQWDVADACHLKNYRDGQFRYLVYLQQVLSMVPKKNLGEALKEAYRIGSDDSVYIFSFMDWDSRWFNPYLSFILNTWRLISFRKPSKFYLPELKKNRKLNKGFFKRDQHPIFWARTDRVSGTLEEAGFKIIKIYRQKDISGGSNDLALYFICQKNNSRQSS